MSVVLLLCGTYRLSQIEQYQQPDLLVLHDKKGKTCLLIDIDIPDSNANTKETEKLSKYKDLEIKVSGM